MNKPRPNIKAAELQTSDWQALIKYFFLWKVLLIVVACASPGPGYDTSTQILFDQYEQPPKSLLGRGIKHLTVRLTRWDGIYFSASAARGHVNEQDWAFSWALARSTSFVSRVIFSSLSLPLVVRDAFTGILISTTSHLIAVLALYHLTYNVIRGPDSTKRRIAFVASCLHIISPAGVFLSAPYGESTFAMLNFTGALSYVIAIRTRLKPDARVTVVAMWTVFAGLCFGLATMVRSNGILGGLIFAWDAVEAISQPGQLIRDSKTLTRFAATVFAGSLMGVGFAAPQVVAYTEYCTGGNSRPWCTRLIPSIYSWVQDHYWEVGFLRYWTLNNLPLFLLAGPMLVLLLYTGFLGLIQLQVVVPWPAGPKASSEKAYKTAILEGKVYNHVMPRLALQQTILAGMAATSFHVQIVNRISSGYPVLYILLASVIYSSTRTDEPERKRALGDTGLLSRERSLQWIVRGIVMYAIIQGGLYASFLPPA